MQVIAIAAVVEISSSVPRDPESNVLLHFFHCGQFGFLIQMRGRPDSLAFRCTERVGNVDVTEKNDRVVIQWDHAVIQPVWCRSGGLLVVIWGFGESWKVGENAPIRFSFELSPQWIILGGLVDTVRES